MKLTVSCQKCRYWNPTHINEKDGMSWGECRFNPPLTTVHTSENFDPCRDLSESYFPATNIGVWCGKFEKEDVWGNFLFELNNLSEDEIKDRLAAIMNRARPVEAPKLTPDDVGRAEINILFNGVSPVSNPDKESLADFVVKNIG